MNINENVLVKQMIEEGYIDVNKHPSENLFIYNYSRKATYEKVWNEATEMCRGIICDEDGNIISRPFRKFFNEWEIEDKSIVPNLPFEVYEKLDGSLGIMYWINDKPFIATRGSFASEQAIHATEILHKKYSKNFDKLDRNKTYLFEIIYPENHIVINYGDEDDIFLLAVINTETGEEDDISKWGNIFRTVRRYDGIKDYNTITKEFSDENKEGFVVKFSNNFRLKIKFDLYFKLHSLMSSLSEKTVLEYMMNGDLDYLGCLINELDEENRYFYENVIDKYTMLYTSIERECNNFIGTLNTISDDDIEKINVIKGNKYSGILFKMWRNQNYKQSIWRYIKNNRL